MTPPPEPVIFMKAPDTVIGPNDDVVVPPNSTKTDYEVELCVVIGKNALYLKSPDEAAAPHTWLHNLPRCFRATLAG